MLNLPDDERSLIEWFSPEGAAIRRLVGKDLEASYNVIREERIDNKKWTAQYLYHGISGKWTVSLTTRTFIATADNKYAFAYYSPYSGTSIDLYVDGIKQATLGPYDDEYVHPIQDRNGLVRFSVYNAHSDSSLVLVYKGDGTELLRIHRSGRIWLDAASKDAVLVRNYDNPKTLYQFERRDGFRSEIDYKAFPRCIAWGQDDSTAFFASSDSVLALVNLYTGKPIWRCERCKNPRDIEMLDGYVIALCFQYNERPRDKELLLYPVLYAIDPLDGKAMGMKGPAMMNPPDGAFLYPQGHKLYYLDEAYFEEIRACDIEVCFSGWERKWAWTATDIDAWALIFRSLIETGKWSVAHQDTIFLALETACGTYDPMPVFFDRISDIPCTLMPASMCPRDKRVWYIELLKDPGWHNPFFRTKLGNPPREGEWQYHGEIISSDGKSLVDWH